MTQKHSEDALQGQVFLLGIDAGGTHTDAVLLAQDQAGLAEGRPASPGALVNADSAARLSRMDLAHTPLAHMPLARMQLLAAAKVPTKHDDLPASVSEVLAALGRALDESAASSASSPTELRGGAGLLGRVSRVTLGATLAVNALVQGKADAVALALSAGPGLDPRRFALGKHVCVVPGGLDHRGTEISPLDVSELEKQAVKLHQGWENELVIGVDDTFPFSLLTPLIEAFYQHHSVTRLIFINGVLGGSWDALTQGRADIFVGALHEPPQLSDFGFARLGVLEQVFAVAPHHPLAQAKEPLANKQLSQHRAIVIRDSARYCHPLNSNLLDEQPQIGVDDFASKVELLCAGLGCGFLPRHIARPWLVKGSLVEKSVACWREKDITYMAWRSGNDGLAQRWWREALLRGDLLSQLYH